MDGLKCIFNNRAVQKTLLVTSLIIGIGGVFTSANRIAAGDDVHGGIAGGLMSVSIGLYGLRKLSHSDTPKL